jgi:predicted transcriptional regulator
MARPRKDKTMQAVSLRLPDALVEQVDACADQLQRQTPLLEVTRTDALRYLIQMGLAEFDKQQRRPSKQPRSR